MQLRGWLSFSLSLFLLLFLAPWLQVVMKIGWLTDGFRRAGGAVEEGGFALQQTQAVGEVARCFNLSVLHPAPASL